jgi:hypothetical protein
LYIFLVVSAFKVINHMQTESFSGRLLALQSQSGEVTNWPFRTARRAENRRFGAVLPAHILL